MLVKITLERTNKISTENWDDEFWQQATRKHLPHQTALFHGEKLLAQYVWRRKRLLRSTYITWNHHRIEEKKRKIFALWIAWVREREREGKESTTILWRNKGRRRRFFTICFYSPRGGEGTLVKMLLRWESERKREREWEREREREWMRSIKSSQCNILLSLIDPMKEEYDRLH